MPNEVMLNSSILTITDKFGQSREKAGDRNEFLLTKTDYQRIQNWHKFTTANYIDQQQFVKGRKQLHYRLSFNTLALNFTFVNMNLLTFTSLSHVNILMNIYKESLGCNIGKTYQNRNIFCKFVPEKYSITFNEQLHLFFYLIDDRQTDYYLMMELQLVSTDGIVFKIGSVKHPLLTKNREQNWAIEINNEIFMTQNLKFSKNQRKDMATMNNKKGKSVVATIEARFGSSQIKGISCYIPPLTIIDNITRIPSILSIDLSNKGSGIVRQVTDMLKFSNIIFRIQNYTHLSRQILRNNPFTADQTQLVSFQIVDYQLLMAMHNTWKYLELDQSPLRHPLTQAANHDQIVQLALTETLNKLYVDCDQCVMLLQLNCKVAYTFRGEVICEERAELLTLGWLPLTLHLAQKESKINTLLINDTPLPDCSTCVPGVRCRLMTTVQSVSYDKYKWKAEELRAYDQLIVSTSEETGSPYNLKGVRIAHNEQQILKPDTKKSNSRGAGSKLSHTMETLDNQIDTLLNKLSAQHPNVSSIRPTGINNPSPPPSVLQYNMVDPKSYVTKSLTYFVSPRSLLPKTSDELVYYIPKEIQLVFYLFRSTLKCACTINETARFQQPLKLSCSLTEIKSTVEIESQDDFQRYLDSELIVLVTDLNSYSFYAKGKLPGKILLLLIEQNQATFLRIPLYRVNDDSKQTNILFGELLIQVFCKTASNVLKTTYIEPISKDKLLSKLPTRERQQLRIAHHNSSKEGSCLQEATALYRQQTHQNYISNVIAEELANDLEWSYELGGVSYGVLEFTNLDQSDNNVFTFKTDNIDAALVTDHQQFCRVFAQKQWAETKFVKLQEQQNQSQLYYQTKLQYKQSITLLIKLSLQQHCEKTAKIKILLVSVYRNTLPVKVFKIKCKYRPPLLYDAFQGYQINRSKTGELIVPVDIGGQITPLLADAYYDQAHKHVVIDSKRVRSSPWFMQLILLVKQNTQTKGRLILYNLTFIDGEELRVNLGEIHISYLFLPIPTKINESVLLAQASQEDISSVKPFIVLTNHLRAVASEMRVCCRTPLHKKNILVNFLTLQNKLYYQYLYQITYTLDKQVKRVVLPTGQRVFSLKCSNPYPVPEQFSFTASQSKIAIDCETILLDAYSSIEVTGQVSGSVHFPVYILQYDSNELVVDIYHITIESEQVNLELQDDGIYS